MAAQTIVTTGRGLHPTGASNVNRRGAAVMDTVDGAAGVLLWDGLYTRTSRTGAWSRISQPTEDGRFRNPVRPGEPLKHWLSPLPSWDNQVGYHYVRSMLSTVVPLQPYIIALNGYWRPGTTRHTTVDRSTPEGYVGFGRWSTYSKRDWLLFRGSTIRAVIGVAAKVNESALSDFFTDRIVDQQYMIVFRPQGNRLEAAVGSQTVLLDSNVSDDAGYDMCSARVGGTKFWIAAIAGNEVKLWSSLLSLSTTSFASTPLPTLRTGSKKLLLCAFPSGNVGACVIGYGTGGRPDVFTSSYAVDNDRWSTWRRLNEDTDWGTTRPADWVSWCRYPATDTFRLVMTRGRDENNTTRIYETPSTINTAPTAPSWVSPDSGSAHSRQSPITLRWQFNDPDPGDAQTAYTVRRRTNRGTRYRTAAGWQTADNANSKLPGNAASLTLTQPWSSTGDGTHSYNVRTWDNADEASPWSASLAINHGEPHHPTITAPVANSRVDKQVDVTWTSASQSAYRIELRQGTTPTGRVIYDSGEIISADRLHTLTMDATGVLRTIVLCTWSSTGLMSDQRSVTVTTDFSLPLLPSVRLLEEPYDGLIKVIVAQATVPSGSQAPAVTDWYVERRDHDDDGSVITIAEGLPAGTTVYSDRTVQHSTDYDYRVTDTADGISNTTGWVT